MRIADPRTLEDKLPQSLIDDWLRYFAQKEERFDKLEYYLVQVSGLIGSIVGADPKSLVYPRPGEKRARRRRSKTAAVENEAPPASDAATDADAERKVSPQTLEVMLRLAFGV